jgi:hypothetical protein
MLGAAGREVHEGPPLVIPISAPLITGERAVVYVMDPQKPGSYEGREVLLGPRARDYYVVRSGLKKGEMVVVNGNFKIDSAMQILSKASMMGIDGGDSALAHHHPSGSDAAKAETLSEVPAQMNSQEEAANPVAGPAGPHASPGSRGTRGRGIIPRQPPETAVQR